MLCCAANKTGKSLLLACLINKHALLGKAGNRYCWLAPYYRTTRIGYDLISKIIKSTPIYNYLKDTNNPNQFKFNASNLQITYPNKNIIDFISGNNVEALYGYKYNFVAIDEATRLKQEQVILSKAENTLKTPGLSNTQVSKLENQVSKISDRIKGFNLKTIGDQNKAILLNELRGNFKKPEIRDEFYKQIQDWLSLFHHNFSD